MTPTPQPRTRLSLRNTLAALAFTLGLFVLNFFSRRLFLRYLSAELLGLNSTVSNILEMLNVAELGISTAIAASLYAPLARADHREANRIIALQRALYRYIGCAIVIAGAAVMAFFPLIFAGASGIKWYHPYIAFAAVLLNAALFYFINYKQIAYTASQESYRLRLSFQSVTLLKLTAQIAAIVWLPYKYEVWVALEVAFALLATLSLQLSLRRHAPWLRPAKLRLSTLRAEYPHIVARIKQMAFHKGGQFAMQQLVPLILYALASLAAVAAYFNYQLLAMAGITVMWMSLDSITGNIGHLVASEERPAVVKVFAELHSLQYLLGTLLAALFFLFASRFVALWLGEQYVLGPATVVAMTAWMLLGCVRYVNDGFLAAYALFSDIYAPIAEIALTLALAIPLGVAYGLDGIVWGAVASQLAVIFLWKPYFLHRRGLKASVSHYALRTALLLVIAAIALAATMQLPSVGDGWAGLAADAVIAAVAYTAIFAGLAIALLPSMRRACRRFTSLIRKPDAHN